MLFSERLRELRAEKKLTQIELGKKTGLSNGCIAMLEINKREPSGNTLIALSNFFECSIDYLLGREDDLGNVVVQSTDPPISAEEKQLLENFRALPDDLKHRANNYLQSLSDAARQERLTMFQK